MIIDVTNNIIGGLAVLLLIWLWNDVFPRVFRRLFSCEPAIGGNWKTTFKEGNKEYHELVELTQKGRKVSGKITLKLENDETAIYHFEGTFKHLILTCTYQSTDPAEYEQGVFALKY